MVLEVLLFGPQSQLAGARRLRLELPGASATAAEVLRAVGAAAPGLGPSLGASRLAVNHAFAPSDAVIGPADEVALVGMVSGG